MRVKVGRVAFLREAGSGYLIGLDEHGHRIEAMGDWRAMTGIEAGAYAEVESWQVIAVDDEIRVDLGPQAMRERAAFLRAAMATMDR